MSKKKKKKNTSVNDLEYKCILCNNIVKIDENFKKMLTLLLPALTI